MRGVNDEMFPAPGTHDPTDAAREARVRASTPDREPSRPRGPMLYSAEAMEVADRIVSRHARRIKDLALAFARRDGRTMVTPDDVLDAASILDQGGGS